MVDGALSDDRNIETTEAWKIKRYQEFAFEERGNSDRSCSATIGYRGPRNSLERLSEATYLSIKDLNGCAQMSAFSGTVHVPRKVLHL